MLKTNGILRFNNLSQFPHLIHGFSTRGFGDMRPLHFESAKSLEKFSSALLDKTPPNLPLSGEEHSGLHKIVRMHQVHSATVRWVGEGDRGKKIEETDGLLTADGDVFVSVVTADCVPVFLFDKEKQLLGAVHAGWRGVYKEIVKEAVTAMLERGSKPEDIIVGIGPCIRSCCYDIGQGHAEMFRSKFPHWGDALTAREGKMFLNLQLLVKYQLRSLGIPDTNIEEAEICTAESEDLYSCRREGEGFGEFVGIIGKSHAGAQR